jgi:hypothetical protein
LDGVNVKLKLAKGQDATYQMMLSDYGSVVTVTPPTTKILEAPESVYKA